MNQQTAIKKSRNILTFFFMLLTVCLLSGIPAQAAGLSPSDITTTSGGKFVKRDGKWMYRQKDGSYAKDCLLKINGKTYYFSKNGYRQSGWKKIENDYYYFGKQSEGYLYQLRWLKLGNQTYFLKKSGKRATGWMTWQGQKYYFNQKGQRLSGWQVIQKKKYYFGTASQGYLYRNRLFTYKKYTFYLQNSGAVATGWKTVSGNRYYFLANGRAATGKRTVNGEVCYFNTKGILQYTGANLNISSKCAILIDADTGKVLYSKNATQKHANASTTKILTCILTLENASLSDRVSVSANAASQEPSKLYMTAGDSFTLKDLLYSLMLPSHNDTAVAIAEHISGSTSAFAKKMNAKAKQIGCTSTHFVTPNGLDAGLNHYTTAQDLAKIARYAWKNATFRKIVGTSSWHFSSKQGRSYSVSTTNALLGTMTGITGMKTGFTNKAGYCFVGVVKAKSGKQYISVTLGAGSSTARWQDARTLLAYAYKH